MLVFFAAFLLIGAAGLIVCLLRPAYQSWKASRWNELPCTILTSDLDTIRGNQGRRAGRLELAYQYRVHGELHTSTRLEFYSVWTQNLAAMRARAEALSPGTPGVCYVNPEDPDDAVMQRDLSTSSILSGIASSGFLIAGLVGTASTVFWIRRSRSAPV